MPSRLFYTGPSLAVLHSEYARRGRIDAAAPVTNTSSLLVGASVRQVWAALCDLRNRATWDPDFRLRELAHVTPGASFRWTIRGARIRSTFAVVDPERELTWTGTSTGLKAVDRNLLEPVDSGRTRVTVQESLAGPLLTLFYSPAKLRAGHEAYLTALKTAVESS
jgi:hypothetical protein